MKPKEALLVDQQLNVEQITEPVPIKKLKTVKDPNLISITLKHRDAELVFEIHKSRDVSDIRSKCSQWLKTNDFSLVYGGEELLSEDTLELAGLVEDATIRITLFSDVPLLPKPGYITSPVYDDLVISKDLS